MGFRFDELGRFLFERLCREVLAAELGVPAATWQRSVRSSAIVIADGAGLPTLERRLEGPTLVVAAWARPGAARRLVEEAIDEWRGTRPRSTLVLTNLVEPSLDAEVVDAAQLSRLVGAHAAVRLRLPSVLGLADEADLVDAEVRGSSTADFDAAFALARVFVPTRAYAATLDVLDRLHFAVLTGPPEMGKTATARMIGLAKASAGWELHECIRPEQVWERYDRERPQVFVADDAFGSTEYRPDAAERWAVDLDRVLHGTDDRHLFLWTSRPAPLKAALRRIHREHGVERFPQPAAVQVDAADLAVDEKAFILFRHAKRAELPPPAAGAVRAHGFAIVSHEHFTPERIRRFAARRLRDLHDLAPDEVEAVVAAEIEEPTAAMAESFRALAPEHAAVLVALLDVPPGPVPERELVAAVRRHTGSAFARHPGELLDRLADHFVRVGEDGAVTWVHPSWRDLVVAQLGESPAERQAFLAACSLDGLLLALSTGGGATGTRALPLLVDDADWDAAGDRVAHLVPALDDPDATRLLVALDEAMLHVAPDAAAELDALAGATLGALARHWDGERTPRPVGLLARWSAVSARVAEPPRFPDAVPTWIDLLPTDEAPVDLAELDDWLHLAELVRDHAPERLGALGFPDRDVGALTAFVRRVRTEPQPPEEAPTVRRALTRLAGLVPELAADAEAAAAGMTPHREPIELVELRELPPELEALLDAPAAGDRADRLLVAAVLRDL